jgi:phage recombination protein Bet
MKPTRFKGSHAVSLPKQLDPPVVTGSWTAEQMALVKRTVAKDATTDELALFMTMANRMQLDVFARQIYFSKFSGKVTIMVSIDGVRLIAHRTGKWNGTRRGVKYDEKGNVTHGWAEVWVKGADHSVYEETPFSEYVQTFGNWKSKPETMIKKCAEMAALRIAFPQELSNAYIAEEFGHDEQEIKEKTVSESIADRFQEELCQSSKSSNQLESPKDSPKESSEISADTAESTSPQSSQEGSFPVQDDGFADILQPQDSVSKT